MTETMAAWSAPECPFKIEYGAHVFEDIRLAVMDAFFSLPRGGAEIGGILLGKPDRARLSITGYAPMECEHAFGPSFVLSPNDHRRLSEMLAAHRRGPGGIVAVGWYHSHTRSEIFLTEIDLEIHQRYFPEPWQVALVLKPHAFQAMRGGFFFREESGSIRTESCYQEFTLGGSTGRQPAGSRDSSPTPSSPPPGRAPAPPPPPPPPVDDRAAARAIARKLLEGEPMFNPPAEPAPPPPMPAPTTRFDEPPRTFVWDPPEVAPAAAARPQPEPEPEPVAEPDPEPQYITEPEPQPEAEVEAEPEPAVPAQLFKAPEFLTTEPKRSRRWLPITIGLLGGLGLGAAAYQTRETWLPKITGSSNSEPGSVSQATGLQSVDLDGQLQIRWDRNSAAVQAAREGILTIQDGGTPLAIELDKEHLQAGSFTYGRQGERVEIALVLHGADGKVTAREASTYLGKLPVRPAPVPDDPQVRKERDELAKQADSLSKDLKEQRARTQKLEKSLEDIKTEVKRDQKRRLENQNPDK